MATASNKTVVDLGSGTGSTLRAFAAQSAELKFLNWRLVDQDAALLAEANRRHGKSHRLKTFELDLANISALPLDGADLITASALFDLVSADFIDKLVSEIQNKCQQAPVGFYAALNYDGWTSWTPSHALDSVVLDAFNRDQQRDKGFGQALGPDAGAYMEQKFTEAGFKVLTANSPWQLDGHDGDMLSALITGISRAVAQDPALDAAIIENWIQFRKAHSATGTCTVGHTDLLALPNTG
jgi:SAM-dependent methyltransferase